MGPAAKPRQTLSLGFHGAVDESLAKAELANQRLVALVGNALEIVELATTLADQLQETTARMMILRVGLEVPGEFRDTRREDCDLDLGRTRVCLMGSVLSDDFSFF